MDEITSELLEVSVDTDATVEIDSKLPEANLAVTKSITAEIQPENYVLTSGGMYTGNMTGATPTWLLNAIQQELTTGDGNVTSVLNDMQLLLDDLQLGVNQAISQIENTNVSMSALETSLASRIDGNQAAILDVYATRVTATEAQAIAATAIGATFNGNVDAYIGNLASVYTDAGSATATNISTLQASYNDQTARIDTVEEVSVFKNATISSATEPTLITHPLLVTGDLWLNTTNNVVKAWNGTAWIDTTNTDAINATTTSATALAKLVDLEEARDGVIDTFYVTTAPLSGMSYGDYWVDTDSWTGSTYVVYRYEALDGSSVGTLAWRTNTGETAVALSKAYRADVLAGTAQSTADGKIKTWYQTSAPTGLTTADIGDLWVDTDAGNLTKTWSGTAWVDIINTQSNTAYGWSANASKMITAPDGSVTGWSFGDGSNIQSYFKIKATNFSVSDGTTGYTPFSITGTDINFLGKVTLAGLGIDSDTTTIDGGKITTGKIQSANTNTYFDLTNNQIKMNNGSFILDSTAAGTSAAPNIQGGYIKATTIGSSNGSFSISPTGVIAGASLTVTTDVSAAIVYGDTFRIKSSYAGQTGVAAYVRNDNILYGQNYVVGHNERRVCSTTSSISFSEYKVGLKTFDSHGDLSGGIEYMLGYTIDNGATWVFMDQTASAPKTLTGHVLGVTVPVNGHIRPGIRTGIWNSSTENLDWGAYVISNTFILLTN